MTAPALAPPPADAPLERAIALVLLVVFWAAFACLALGLALWLADRTALHAARLLTAGIVGLLSIPIVRVAAILVTSARERDGITFAATLTVLVILLALTLRDAGRQ